MLGVLKSLSEVLRGKPLVSGEVYLRPPGRGDWKQWSILRGKSRGFLEPWEPTWSRDTLTRKAFLRRLRAYALNSQSDTGYSFFVFRTADDQLLGGISLNHVRRGVSQTCSIGYWIGEQHARRGYMTAALSGLLPFAFDHLCLHRISAAPLPHNTASRTLLQNIGFSEEGFARKYLRINGEWQDHVVYAMLNTDPRPSMLRTVSKSQPEPNFAAEIDRAVARVPHAQRKSSG
jgi:ribosomal-protein-alanine N-acetyltransferase